MKWILMVLVCAGVYLIARHFQVRDLWMAGAMVVSALCVFSRVK